MVDAMTAREFKKTLADRISSEEAAKWVRSDGRYRCPSMAPDSTTCRYCVCEEMTDDEKIDFVAARILRKYKPAFLELAKGDE